MKSVEQFLRQRSQTSASISPFLPATDLSHIELDLSLTSAVMRGWHIAPVLARRKYFPRKALAGYPTQDLVQIRHWVREYSKCGCNWAVETGIRSHLLVLEFDYAASRKTLPHFCKEDWSWRTSLQFSDPHAHFVCFCYSGQRLRAIGREYPGIRIHLGSCILIPNSRRLNDSEVSYLNPHAPVLELPSWLLYVARSNSEVVNPDEDDEASYEAA